jgi:hypothetical protein
MQDSWEHVLERDTEIGEREGHEAQQFTQEAGARPQSRLVFRVGWRGGWPAWGHSSLRREGKVQGQGKESSERGGVAWDPQYIPTCPRSLKAGPQPEVPCQLCGVVAWLADHNPVILGHCLPKLPEVLELCLSVCHIPALPTPPLLLTSGTHAPVPRALLLTLSTESALAALCLPKDPVSPVWDRKRLETKTVPFIFTFSRPSREEDLTQNNNNILWISELNTLLYCVYKNAVMNQYVLLWENKPLNLGRRGSTVDLWHLWFLYLQIHQTMGQTHPSPISIFTARLLFLSLFPKQYSIRTI